jgi:hypothetical protein
MDKEIASVLTSAFCIAYLVFAAVYIFYSAYYVLFHVVLGIGAERVLDPIGVGVPALEIRRRARPCGLGEPTSSWML